MFLANNCILKGLGRLNLPLDFLYVLVIGFIGSKIGNKKKTWPFIFIYPGIITLTISTSINFAWIRNFLIQLKKIKPEIINIILMHEIPPVRGLH